MYFYFELEYLVKELRHAGLLRESRDFYIQIDAGLVDIICILSYSVLIVLLGDFFVSSGPVLI